MLAMLYPSNDSLYFRYQHMYFAMLVRAFLSCYLSCFVPAIFNILRIFIFQGLSLVCLITQAVTISVSGCPISMLSVWHLLMDMVACLFNLIMILDGTNFWQYSYIFAFCVIIPQSLDFFFLALYIVKKPLVNPRKKSFLSWLW